MNIETSDDPIEGRNGPTYETEMNKRSVHLREWRIRQFRISDRRIYYYDEEADMKPRDDKPMGEHKGWLDLTGATLTPFDEEDEEVGKFFGVEIKEEYTLSGSGEQCEPETYILCSSNSVQRDRFIEILQYACRPTWLDDSSTETCMGSNEKFTFFDRRHHCRRCGGIYISKMMTEVPMPSLNYTSSVLVCKTCDEGKSLISRWVRKVPKCDRPVKAKDLGSEVTDTVMDGTRKALSAVGNFLQKFK